MKPTEEQQNYIEKAGVGNDIIIEALAGCAKTSTGIAMCNARPNKKIRFIVFNKKNADEMQGVLPKNAIGATRHSTCLKWFRKRPFVNTFQGAWQDRKSKNLKHIFAANPSWDFTKLNNKDEKYSSIVENASSASDVLSLAKNTFINPTIDELSQLAINHGIVFTEFGWEDVVRNALKTSDNDRDEVDFDDFTRFAVLDNNVICDSDIFILDEAQDSNPITIEMVRMMSEKCEVHSFGDRFQSIYGFMGADVDAMDKLAASIQPKHLLPLTVNFRCSKAVIEETRLKHPNIDIKAWEGAREGSVSEIGSNKMIEIMQPGDCIISRYNKLIIPLAFKLIKSGKRATIQGNKDFVNQIVRVVKSIKTKSKEEFFVKLEEHRDRALAKAKTELGQEIINDKFDAIECFAINAWHLDAIVELINTTFSEQKSDYKLSTAHRSKGLQFMNVFMLDHNNFQAKQATTPNQIQQENNLAYVARTRAQDKLYYVNLEKEA